MPILIKLSKVPRWYTHGIDLHPYAERTVESVSSNMEKRQGKGVGARRNEIGRERDALSARISSTRHHPRRTGLSWERKQTGIFNGIAPRAVKKYVTEPLKQLWEQTQNVSS